MNGCGCAQIQLWLQKKDSRPNLAHGPQFTNPELDKKICKFHKGIPLRFPIINKMSSKNPKLS